MYEIIESIAGETGAIGRLQLGVDPTFLQLFNGSPQFYAGSMVQVQEILTIITAVVKPEFVDVDFQWFNPQKRLGTYQVLDSIGLTRNGENDDGFLNSEIFRIYRYSYYTITANPDTEFGISGGLVLENCNFFLKPDVYLFPDDPTPETGFSLYDKSPTFIGSSVSSKAPLANTEFNQRIRGVGLYLRPGVEGRSIRYQAAIINDIYTDYAPVGAASCEFQEVGCEAQFAAFINSSSGEGRGLTRESCEASRPPNFISCQPNVWICPSDPTFIRQYWNQANE